MKISIPSLPTSNIIIQCADERWCGSSIVFARTFRVSSGQKSRPIGIKDYVVTRLKLTRGPSRFFTNAIIDTLRTYLSGPLRITAIGGSHVSRRGRNAIGSHGWRLLDTSDESIIERRTIEGCSYTRYKWSCFRR